MTGGASGEAPSSERRAMPRLMTNFIVITRRSLHGPAQAFMKWQTGELPNNAIVKLSDTTPVAMGLRACWKRIIGDNIVCRRDK